MVPFNLMEVPDEFLPPIEGLPGDLAKIAEAVRPYVSNDCAAVRVVFALSIDFESTQLYFHNLDDFRRRWRNLMLRQDYDRMSRSGEPNIIQRLARKYSLSVRWAWDILGRADEKAFGRNS